MISKPKQLESYEEMKLENSPNELRVIWTDKIWNWKRKFSIKEKLKKKKK